VVPRGGGIAFGIRLLVQAPAPRRLLRQQNRLRSRAAGGARRGALRPYRHRSRVHELVGKARAFQDVRQSRRRLVPALRAFGCLAFGPAGQVSDLQACLLGKIHQRLRQLLRLHLNALLLAASIRRNTLRHRNEGGWQYKPRPLKVQLHGAYLPFQNQKGGA